MTEEYRNVINKTPLTKHAIIISEIFEDVYLDGDTFRVYKKRQDTLNKINEIMGKHKINHPQIWFYMM